MRLTGLYKDVEGTEETGVKGKLAGMRWRRNSALSQRRVALCLHRVKNTFHLDEKETTKRSMHIVKDDIKMSTNGN